MPASLSGNPFHSVLSDYVRKGRRGWLIQSGLSTMATVLVVDDDEIIRDVLCELFNEEHLCHATATAEQALVLLETIEYDVAVVDISLPGMSGLELLGHMRQRWPKTPVIIITGIDYHQYVADLIRMGASDYLVKPFKLQDAEGKISAKMLKSEGWLDAVKESANRALQQDSSPEESADRPFDRRHAARHKSLRAARLLFTVARHDLETSSNSEPDSLSVIGHTRDISANGLSLVVPGLHIRDAELFGTQGALQLTLSLPTGIVDIEATPVRYEWLSEESGNKSYLIGARISGIRDDERVRFDQYLSALS
jgi:DNA-binding response OmpR family regulator